MKVTVINDQWIQINFVSYDQPLDWGLKEYISDWDVVLNQEWNRWGDAFAVSTSVIMNNWKLYTVHDKDKREELVSLTILSCL